MTGQEAGAALLRLSPHIRIVNLAHRSDRRREMTTELAKLGLTLGNDIRLHDAARPDTAGAFPSIGARGCFMSHVELIEAAIAEGLSSVMIFEDDLSFSEDEIARIPTAVAASIPHDWSIFYGGILRYEGADIDRQERPLFVTPPGSGMMGSHFIALRGDAMPKAAAFFRAMLERPAGSVEGGPMHVDGAYGWLRKTHPELVTLVAHPVLGHQRASRTDVHAQRWFDRVPVIREIVAVLRRRRSG